MSVKAYNRFMDFATIVFLGGVLVVIGVAFYTLFSG